MGGATFSISTFPLLPLTSQSPNCSSGTHLFTLCLLFDVRQIPHTLPYDPQTNATRHRSLAAAKPSHRPEASGIVRRLIECSAPLIHSHKHSSNHEGKVLTDEDKCALLRAEDLVHILKLDQPPPGTRTPRGTANFCHLNQVGQRRQSRVIGVSPVSESPQPSLQRRARKGSLRRGRQAGRSRRSVVGKRQRDKIEQK